jgi:hypothetical protein
MHPWLANGLSGGRRPIETGGDWRYFLLCIEKGEESYLRA